MYQKINIIYKCVVSALMQINFSVEQQTGIFKNGTTTIKRRSKTSTAKTLPQFLNKFEKCVINKAKIQY